MAPQLTISNTNYIARFKSPAVKTICLVVAGLLFTVMLYNRPSNGMSAQQQCLPAAGSQHQPCPQDTNVKSSRANDASPLSLMPGGLTRFLQ